MSNTINLGPAPVLDGTTNDSKSYYLGNNRFVRFIAQRDPDHVVAIMAESTDVNDPLQTLNVLKEQIILPSTYLVDLKISVLGNGKILLSAKNYSGVLQLVVVSYDDINHEFTVDRNHNVMYDIAGIAHVYSRSYDYTYIMEPHGTDDLYVMKLYNGGVYNFKFSSLDSDTPTHIDLGYSNSADTTFYLPSAGIRFIDDKVEFINSTHISYSGSMYDVNTNTALYSFMPYGARNLKLDTDRYIHISRHSKYGNNLGYQLGNSRITTFGALPSEFAPVFSYGSISNKEDIIDIIVMDRQHIVVFLSPKGINKIYARFVKIIDENYAIVSDNSTGIYGIEVCDIIPESARSSFANGHLVNQIDSTHFWVQNGNDEFIFLTMSA